VKFPDAVASIASKTVAEDGFSSPLARPGVVNGTMLTKNAAYYCVVNWTYFGTDESGDVYEFVVGLAAPPPESPLPTTLPQVRRLVKYTGTKLEIYADDFVQITLHPKSPK